MGATTELLDVNDVAEALRVSPHTVRRWAGQKKLTKVKLGSRTLFDPADVARFVEQARAAAQTTHHPPATNSDGKR
jgi:excisionase family DNA binding protein